MKAFRLSARTRALDGTIAPFTLEIDAPIESEREAACLVHCPIMPFDGKPIHGVDGRQAMALALWIVENQLEHRGLVLIDDDSRVIHLPIDRGAGIPGEPDRDDLD